MSCDVHTFFRSASHPNSATDDPSVDHPGDADEGETASTGCHRQIPESDDEQPGGDDETVDAGSEHNELAHVLYMP